MTGLWDRIPPGIPIWQLGAESRHPDLLYILFPGNVGRLKTLVEIEKFK